MLEIGDCFAKIDAFYVAKQEGMTPGLNSILYSANVLSHNFLNFGI
jgi:hypothetical protein